MALLLQRVARLASVEQLHDIHAELTRIEQKASDRSNDNTTHSDDNNITSDKQNNEAQTLFAQQTRDETEKEENVKSKAPSRIS